uniref:Uncharacterized protein n=1 Tax=Strongyloides venezuelensis TaxID=75913 RepID=A0A0K0G588_STRVS
MDRNQINNHNSICQHFCNQIELCCTENFVDEKITRCGFEEGEVLLFRTESTSGEQNLDSCDLILNWHVHLSDD